MKEPFDDAKLYDDAAQAFGSFAIRNAKEVLQSYNYSQYEQRFRSLADRHKLAPGQRPKLDETQFSILMKDLATHLLTSREPDSLGNAACQKAAQRLLILQDFHEDEDWR